MERIDGRLARKPSADQAIRHLGSVWGFIVGVIALVPNPFAKLDDVTIARPVITDGLDDNQYQQLLEAINSLKKDPPSSTAGLPTVADAIAKFENGDLSGAKAILEQVKEERTADAKAALAEKAVVTRHLASIAFVTSKGRSIVSLQRGRRFCDARVIIEAAIGARRFGGFRRAVLKKQCALTSKPIKIISDKAKNDADQQRVGSAICR
ncbi:MAG: hypothetical protein U5K75_01055 [Ahrensia sp.]|nr:hypothetical protein [Ahrensia sp.]